MKTCTKCKIEKPIDDFYRTNTGSPGSVCKICYLDYCARRKQKIKEIPKIIIEHKTCNICHIEKNISEFQKCSQTYDGYQLYCKDCLNHKNREHYKNNVDKIRAQKKSYRDRNAEYYKSARKKYYDSHKEMYHRIQRDSVARNYPRRKNDPQFRITRSIRERGRCALKGKIKLGSFVKALGCTVEFFQKYIESKFLPGMSWNNYGNGLNKWVLDHIIPLSHYDLEDELDFLTANHYTNIQPLWFTDNAKKSDKLPNELLKGDSNGKNQEERIG